MSLRYRPEIDGLRTIAVGSVILYHMKLHWGAMTVLPGGYLGVDIFFVLSGFLITGILLKELAETGRVSLKTFYWRRVRRILPPLVLVILASLPVAWMVLLPSELERFSTSLWAALGFVSNGYWFFEQKEYGAQSALLQPFLHTWSLAIEEQFYLVFPLVLAAIYRFRVGLILAGLILLSLVASEATTAWKSNFSFYSPVSRAWELLAGSLLAWLTVARPGALRGMAGARMIPALALVVIGLCICLMPLDKVPHPGLVTVPLILATCALIWFTGSGAGSEGGAQTPAAEPVTRLLSSAPFVFIGKLSYSLYLWHFPVFAFGRLALGNPGVTEMTGLLALTVLLSVAGYYLVERPFRFRLPPRPFFGTLAATLAGVAVFTGVMLAGQGFPARFTGPGSLYVGHDFDNEELRADSWRILQSLTAGERIEAWNAMEASRHELEELWFRDPDRIHVLVVGNSHSKDMFNALYLNRAALAPFEFARFSVDHALPEEDIDRLLRTPNFAGADVVLIAHRFVPRALERLPDTIRRIRAEGKPVVLVADRPEFADVGSMTLLDWYLRGIGETARDPETINAMAHDRQSPVPAEVFRQLNAIAEQTGAVVLSLQDIVCPGDSCTLMTPDRRKVFYDDHHWSLAGATLFGRRIAESGWLDPLAALAAAPPSN